MPLYWLQHLFILFIYYLLTLKRRILHSSMLDAVQRELNKIMIIVAIIIGK